MRPHRAMLESAALGALLGLGAPVGWLALRAATGTLVDDSVAEELATHRLLYGYLAAGTCGAFAVFGAVLGDLLDRRLRANRVLAEQSITDALTGLRNPRYFHERLEEECRRADRGGAPLGLIVMDVDLFKRVNDHYGHAAGDRALAHAAAVLASCARASDVACRIGGEEFALVCPGTELENAVAIAERVRRGLEANPAPIGAGVSVSLTASFGVAVRRPGTPAQTLFDAADDALYAAKQLGRNRVEVGHRPAGSAA